MPDRYLEPGIETMPRAEIEAAQEAVLLERVVSYYERSPLYREFWDAADIHPKELASLADFRAVAPFIDKDALRAFRDRTGDPFGGVLCRPERLTCVTSSSGTTGDATLFPERWERYPPLQVNYLRALWEMGLRPGDRVIDGPNTFKRGGEQEVFTTLGLVPVMVNTWAPRWDGVVDVVRRLHVNYLHVLGPGVVELDRLSETVDIRAAFASVKAVSFAGEPLGARMQQRFRDDWDVPLFMYTSTGDTGTSWECQVHDGYHIWEDQALVECVAVDGSESVADGTLGELTVTDLDNDVFPLVRFRTDDLVRIDRSQCPCGRTHVRQWPAGRRSDLTIVGDASVMPVDVWRAVEQIPETVTGLFQIIRPTSKVDELHIRVGYRLVENAELSTLEDRLRASILAEVGVEPRIDLVTDEEILARGTGSKVPRVVKA